MSAPWAAVVRAGSDLAATPQGRLCPPTRTRGPDTVTWILLGRPRAGGAVDPRRPGLSVRLVPGTHPADSAIATGTRAGGPKSRVREPEHRTVTAADSRASPARRPAIPIGARECRTLAPRRTARSAFARPTETTTIWRAHIGGYARASYASGGGGASRVPRIAGDVTAVPALVSCVLVSYAPCAERRRL